MKIIKHLNLDNREKMCFNCCNVYPPEMERCPICLARNGMLINESNRNAMQIRHMIMRDPLPIISYEAVIRNGLQQLFSTKEPPTIDLVRKRLQRIFSTK